MQKTAVSLIALTASAAPAAAQNTETSEGETDSRTTIVVTGESFVGDEVVSANKDGGDILTTPQAISVVEDDFIDALNLRTMSEALNYTSGVRSQSFGSDTRIEYYQIRGFRNILWRRRGPSANARSVIGAAIPSPKNSRGPSPLSSTSTACDRAWWGWPMRRPPRVSLTISWISIMCFG